MLSLLAPGALLALAVLVLPPLLHLRRRSEQKQVRFAALHWLGQGARPRRQLQLQHIPLLLLRLALLAALVLLLALPVWRAKAAPGSSWAVVMPGIDATAARATAPDPAAQWRWLAAGFPPLDGPAPQPPGVDFSSLLRQFDAQLPPGATVQVLLPQELSGLDAERLKLGHAVEWRVVAGATPPQTTAHQDGPLRLAVRYDTAQPAGLPLVHALAAAWRAAGIGVELDEAQADAAPAAPTDALFWLGAATPNATLRQWARNGGTLIAATSESGDSSPAADFDSALPQPLELGQGRLLLFPGTLDPARNAALRDPRLPERLLALLRHAATPPSRAPAASVAPITAAVAQRGNTQPLDRWLALCAALLFLAERCAALRAARVAS